MTFLTLTIIEEVVIRQKRKYEERWQDKEDSYWFMRLQEEMGELSSSLLDRHDDPPELELKEIATIAMNWLEKLDKEKTR